MAYQMVLRIPRPRTFLYLMSLRTGTSLITLTLLINKLSGLYGILALLTGLPLNPLQLSMYLYSITALVLTATLAPHIRAQSPLQCLALAYFYLLDSVINAAYTVAFGVAWFLVLAQHTTPLPGSGSGSMAPGAGTIGDTSGFTDPDYNVTSVNVVLPTATTQDAQLIGYPAASTPNPTAGSSSTTGALTSTILQSGSIASISVISALWALRLYFILVVLAYARAVLRAHIVAASQTPGAHLASSGTTSDGRLLAENPFAVGREEGQGWRGVLGRWMVSIGKGYWLGPDEEGEWARDFGGRFGKGGDAGAGAAQTGSSGALGGGKVGGVGERERRRRAGTGPPSLRAIELDAIRKD